VYERQWALGGHGRAVVVHSDNEDAAAVEVHGAGALVRMFDAAGVLRFGVDGDGTVSMSSIALSGDLPVSGDVTVGETLAVTGTTTLTGAVQVGSTLGVTGASTFSGGISGATVITGDLTLQGTGKAYRFRRSGSALDLDATGVDLLISNFSGSAFDGTQRAYFRLSADAQNVQVAGKVEYVDSLYGATRHVIDGAANTVGFHGATPVGLQTVSGSRASGAALADLLTKLAAKGLITDGSSE
jgi:hypothetical protein